MRLNENTVVFGDKVILVPYRLVLQLTHSHTLTLTTNSQPVIFAIQLLKSDML